MIFHMEILITSSWNSTVAMIEFNLELTDEINFALIGGILK